MKVRGGRHHYEGVQKCRMGKWFWGRRWPEGGEEKSDEGECCSGDADRWMLRGELNSRRGPRILREDVWCLEIWLMKCMMKQNSEPLRLELMREE